MPYTSIPTVASGQTIDPAWGNLVDTNLDFLANPPACRVYNNANQAINDNTETTVAFNSERFDTDGMHSTSVNTSRITFTAAGLYVVTFHGSFIAGNDYTTIGARLRLNGATYLADDSRGTMADAVTANYNLHVTTLWKFAATDYIEARVVQNNTANTARNLISATNTSPEFSAVWVGLG